MNRALPPLVLFFVLTLNACGQQATTVAPTPAASRSAPTLASQPSASATPADLSSIKVFLTSKTRALTTATAKLKQTSDAYYAFAQAGNFDYAALWSTKQPAMIAAIQDARAAWVTASPLYEQMEGIVAGTPALAPYDVDIDAGDSAAVGGDNVVSFDLTLPNGTVMPKPGNLFGLTEGSLWGSIAANTVKGVSADLNGDGTIGFGDALPDANILKGGVDMLDQRANDLGTAAAAWQPTEAEAFGALVGNIPTVTDFMDGWKNSRFVQTNAAATRSDFVVISRLSDLVNNIGSWQTIYQGLSPHVVQADPAADQQIQQGLRTLHTYIADIAAKEQGGKRYTTEEADLLAGEAQNQATAVTGQITQVAAQLNIKLDT